MCGIFGLAGRALSKSKIEAISDALQHRGPDGNGTFVDDVESVTLVHTRLTVIDLVTGAQPLQSDDGEIVLVANGEIYDFERIRSSLEAKGHRFSTKSDSEVIIYLYKEYGFDFFQHLRGEFAFLLFDRARRLLIAGRDRFGIKPLYFSKLERGFVFGSEMKAIFASGLVAPQINVAAFDPFLSQHSGEVKFPFRHIEHVPPASYLVVDLETYDVVIKNYWSPEIPSGAADTVHAVSDKEARVHARTVRNELEESVRLRLRADVPVGLYLSGGLDSSFIGALMKRGLNSNFHSFSISFLGSDKNEEEFTRRAAAFLGTTHHDLAITREMLWDNLQDCLWFTELPFFSLAPVGKYLLSGEARKFVTVVLNGQGADELFLGYRSFFQRAIAETRDMKSGKRTSPRSARLGLTALPVGLVQRASLLLFHKQHRQHLIVARTLATANDHRSRPLINLVQESRLAEMPIDILGFLGDRVEMAHSLEVRVPFLDHKLYDAAKLIPVDFKMRDGTEKAVLRDAAVGLLPDDLRLRRKQGFMLTTEAVDIHGSDREMVRKYRQSLSRKAFERWGIFSYRSYRVACLLARLPRVGRIMRRIRGHSNKVILFMMQAHMLGELFVENPQWACASPPSLTDKPSDPQEGAKRVEPNLI